jgi:phage-related protein
VSTASLAGFHGCRIIVVDTLSQNKDNQMARPKQAAGEKPLFWVGSTKRDLLAFPEPVKDDIGIALSVAQFGGKHPKAKPWRGEGPGVFELVEDHRGDAYRALYTVRFEGAVYVLHAFQKKSPAGVRTSRPDAELIAQRLQAAKQDYEVRHGQAKN